VPVEEPSQFGMLRTQDGWLRELVEKPSSWDERPLANAGIYVLTPEALEAMKNLAPSERGELEATSALEELASRGDTVRVAEIKASDWLDVGRPWDVLRANEMALRRLEPTILGMVEPGAHLIGPVFVSEGARVRSGAYVEGPVFIGPGADVGPNCYIRPCTSLGAGVRVGNACEIKNSVVMEGTHIGHLSYVGDSVIGAYCNLGAGTITANLRFDKANVKMTVKGERLDTGRRKLGAILGDFVQTGIGALFMPGVRVWPRCWIGANVVVERDITEEGLFLRLNQELSMSEAWEGNR
ncbi:MAG TPA: glucose-1-phosphate thymidylyltransferase, partial [Candidatus Bathyarchaeota archaeon]|nr:glucose-1-phosphate thymidylyltransferase [Candidatus Bathyarchaeota archaeon]HEW89876.1 glucose-1-phosphate thymidylyltransferase [Candidatus Bathyarchaeota archaeon]